MDVVAAPIDVRMSRLERVERIFDKPMLVAALLVIPVLVIDQSSVSHWWKTFGAALNWAVWSAFALELVVMLTVMPKRWSWLRGHPLEAGVVILTPPFLPAGLGALRLFRLLRLLRLAVFVKQARRLFSPSGVRFASLLAFAFALAGGAIFADVEKGHSLWDGVWWAFSTMSTVGYGDLAPKTVIGRVVALCLMVVGVAFFALVTGAVAQRFLSVQVTELEGGVGERTRAEDASREEVLREIRELAIRLGRLEQAVKQL